MKVRLDVIVFDAGTQVREAINENVVAQYAERMSEGDVFPPVVLFNDGNRHYMADGFHRGLAALRIGEEDIDATVQPGTKTDALWFALGANKAHAWQMTAADKRHAILLALQTWPEKSGREIAGQIGCNQNYISEMRREVSATTHLPSRVTGKDGKSYPASRPTRAAEPPPITNAAPVPSITGEEIRNRKEARRVVGPPCNGLQFARLAIMRLEEIADDDVERTQALTLVRRWIDARIT